MTERHNVSVFATDKLEGTSAVVYRLEHPLEKMRMQAVAREEAAPATCFMHHIENNSYSISFFNGTHEIKLCGHGLLASAKVLVEQGLRKIEFVAGNNLVFAEASDNDDVWLKFAELPVEAVVMPAWVSECFNFMPKAAYIAGGINDYWVMEWPVGFELSQLQVNTNKLSQFTQRALIATQISTSPEYDYFFRYFAPQHGVIEDKATGSANRVLIGYWSKELGQSLVTARQLSKEGALLKGRFDHGAVWISGNVVIDE